MLDAKQLLGEAKKITGLSFLGNPLFEEGFNKLVYSINNEADLNDIGIQAQHHRLIGVLSNMLRIEDTVINHPEILNEKIVAPIVIVGLP